MTVVAERAERPTDFAPRTQEIESDPARPCPFCPGHEASDPPAFEHLDRDGRWAVRIVPNLYPAFFGDEPMTVRHLGPVFTQATASGIHEVLVLSPDHNGSWANLDDRAAGDVMTFLRDRMEEHAGISRVRYTQAIVNHGREAGASLKHPHGQLLGMPFVPGEILDEEAAFDRFEGGCLLCTTAEAEMAEGVRVVYQDDLVLIVCPYWSGSPYELLVIPREHESHLDRASAEDLEAVGRGVRTVLANLRSVLGDLSYSLGFHTAPHNHDGLYHWHCHIWPKLTSVAGFERGTGVLVNITPPEFAAAQLQMVGSGARR